MIHNVIFIMWWFDISNGLKPPLGKGFSTPNRAVTPRLRPMRAEGLPYGGYDPVFQAIMKGFLGTRHSVCHGVNDRRSCSLIGEQTQKLAPKMYCWFGRGLRHCQQLNNAVLFRYCSSSLVDTSLRWRLRENHELGLLSPAVSVILLSMECNFIGFGGH